MFIFYVLFLSFILGSYIFYEKYKLHKVHKFIYSMPKVELHIHLEGSIKPKTIFRLANKNNIKLPVKTESELVDFFKFKNFEHFVETYTLITSCLKTQQDYFEIVCELGQDFAKQNILYAEVTFTMNTNMQFSGLSWQEIFEGLSKGREKVEKDFGVKINWIFDIKRDDQLEQELLLEVILNERKKGIVAFGLSGSEDKLGSKEFEKTCQILRDNNIAIITHAGEFAGSGSIWDVLKYAKPKRIGHGVACIKDPKLFLLLKNEQIPLEICVTSNICMKVFPDYFAHPIKKLFKSGIYVTINSDDPALFNTNLNKEYSLLVDRYGFNIKDLEIFDLNALRASLLKDNEKLELENKFKQDFKNLKQELGL